MRNKVKTPVVLCAYSEETKKKTSSQKFTLRIYVNDYPRESMDFTVLLYFNTERYINVVTKKTEL